MVGRAPLGWGTVSCLKPTCLSPLKGDWDPINTRTGLVPTNRCKVYDLGSIIIVYKSTMNGKNTLWLDSRRGEHGVLAILGIVLFQETRGRGWWVFPPWRSLLSFQPSAVRLNVWYDRRVFGTSPWVPIMQRCFGSWWSWWELVGGSYKLGPGSSERLGWNNSSKWPKINSGQFIRVHPKR